MKWLIDALRARPRAALLAALAALIAAGLLDQELGAALLDVLLALQPSSL